MHVFVTKKRLLFFVLLLVSAAVAALLYSGVIVTDHSAERGFENSVTWQGHRYVSCTGRYSEGKTAAKTDDGWELNTVEEDPSKTFLVLRSFTDQYLVVREDFEIPRDGEVTAVWWNRRRITDKNFCRAVQEILARRQTDFDCATDEIFTQTETQNMREIFVSYENCPVATEFKGYLGKRRGQWVMTTETDNGTTGYYRIPTEYHERLESCFS